MPKPSANAPQAGGKPNRGDLAAAVRQPNHARPETEQDDADVLDAVVREQTLEIVLHQRVERKA